jgi:hypothetical protein
VDLLYLQAVKNLNYGTGFAMILRQEAASPTLLWAGSKASIFLGK